MSRLYIYAVVAAEQPLTLDTAGLAGGLHVIAEGAAGAIVGTAPDCDFSCLPEEEMACLQAGHQQVLEAVMPQTTLLPVQFGALAPHEHAVRTMLSRGRDLFAAQLAEFADCVQMKIVVFWQLAEVFAEIATEEDVAMMRQRVQTNGGEDERVRLGESVKAALERRRAALNEEIRSALGTVIKGMAANPVTEENIAADLSVLLNKSHWPLLEGLLRRLDAEKAGRLIFRAAGPLPPARFATVEVSFPTEDAIELARQILQLAPAASVPEIKSAYFRHARTQRADGGGQAAEDAYRLLMACAKTRASDETAETRDGEAAAPVLIKIIRHESQRPIFEPV